MTTKKLILGAIASICFSLLFLFQNCGKQSLSSTLDNLKVDPSQGSSSNSNATTDTKTEIRINPALTVEGQSAKVTFNLNKKLSQNIDLTLKPLNDLSQSYVDKKIISTKYTIPAGSDVLNITIPSITLPDTNNLKLDYEISVSDQKSAYVSTQNFYLIVVPQTSESLAASISVDDQALAGSQLKGSIALLSKSESTATIDWQIQTTGDNADLDYFPKISGQLTIPAGQIYSLFSIETTAFKEYLKDKTYTLKFFNARNMNLVENITKTIKLIDQKPHSAPVFIKTVGSQMIKDFRNSTTVSIESSGIPTPTYQWIVDGQTVSGSSTQYTIPAPLNPKQVSIKVIAQNVYGQVTSSIANIVFACSNNETNNNGLCEVNTTRSCTIAHGIGQQTWITDKWSDCIPMSCDTGFTKVNNLCGCSSTQHLQDNKCIDNTVSCPIVNGIGTKSWNGTDYGSCVVKTCNASFSAFGSTCACQADQTLDTVDNTCKYKVRKWTILSEYGTIGIPVRCSGNYKPWSRPVEGVYNVSGIIIAGASPWLDPAKVDPNFSVSAMRIIETSTCGSEYADGGYPGTTTICYSRKCAMRMYNITEVLSPTK